MRAASARCMYFDRRSGVGRDPYDDRMALALFAEIHVRDFQAAKAWYVLLLGEPSFVAHDTEEVWELAENRSIAVEEQPENAGHGAVTVFVDDLDTRRRRDRRPWDRAHEAGDLRQWRPQGHVPRPRWQRDRLRRRLHRPGPIEKPTSQGLPSTRRSGAHGCSLSPTQTVET
jgi:hypothetical protein